MMNRDPSRTKVLIVGAGPAGLALAIELGHRGVACILIERNERVGYAPRAKSTNVRTREHLRRWGIAGKLRDASPLGVYYPSNIEFVTRLSGERLSGVENAFYCAPGRNPLYAEHGQWIPQYTLEEVLKTHAQSFACVDLRFKTELLSFIQDDNGVSVRMRDLETGRDITVACAYLVGADGARSIVRESIGAKLQGRYGLSRNYNVVFRSRKLAAAHGHVPAIMYWQVNSDLPSLIGPMDKDDRWFFMPTAIPDGMKREDFASARLIARTTGIDVDYEVLSSDEWVASRLRADSYCDGRVFLVGDACHLNPPYGGYGMNLGVGDAVDLGWKLAAVVQGWGGPKLLESYQHERTPVHDFVLDEAEGNHAVLANHLVKDGIEQPGDAGDRLRREIGARIQAAKIREFNTLGIVKGYRYDDSPIIVPDGTEAAPHDFINYVPSARPGCVAPHAWMHDGSSLYDHFGRGFTLLVTVKAEPAEIEAAGTAAQAAAIPLQIVQPTEPAIAGLYGARYALIRPDQHVAWRGKAWSESAAKILARVTGSEQGQ